MDGDVLPVVVRPTTRGECASVPRPCPFATCRYHLATDVDGRGQLRVNWEDVDQMEESCALDVADRTLASGVEPSDVDIARWLNMSKQRIWQLGKLTPLRRLRLGLRQWRDTA